MRAIALFFLTGSVILSTLFNQVLAQDSSRVQVLTTIKPITMLVYAIAKDKAEIKQLIPDFSSAHDYSLKPSDLEKIDQAKVVFRIDEHMEVLLNSAFELMPSSTPLVSLAEDDAIFLLPISMNEHKNQRPSHGHQHGNTDMHIWTSPQNAIKMAKMITKTLSRIDPNNSQDYENNYTLLRASINRAAEAINEDLVVFRKKKYLVFHNAWKYFQKSFSLQEPIIVALQENINPGAKSIHDVRKKIETIQPACIFSDPHVSPSRVDTIIEGFEMKTAEIDVLASAYPVDEYTYIDWLMGMKKRIMGCL